MKEKDFWKKLIKENAVLNPVDRVAEVLFGLIMVLTFTGAISISKDGRQEIRELLWAALACNVAWGLVDAIMYLMNVMIERGHALKVLTKLHKTESVEGSASILKDEIQPLISNILTENEITSLVERIKQVPPPSKKNIFTLTDLFAGVQIFLLVFLCTLPVALPFALFNEVGFALRASNITALVLLFSGGYILSKYAGFRPFLTAIIYTLIGVSLVFLTMALGG